MAITNAVGLVGPSNISFAKTLQLELSVLAKNHPEESEIRLEQAKSIFNLVTILAAKDLATSQELLAGSRELMVLHPGESKIRHIHAMTVNNLLIAVGPADQKTGWPLAEELFELGQEHYDEFRKELPQLMPLIDGMRELALRHQTGESTL